MARTLTADERRELRRVLAEHFDVEELRNLAFDLGAEYEVFCYGAPLGLSREMIAYFERRMLLGNLLEAIVQQRPSLGHTLAPLLADFPVAHLQKKAVIILYESQGLMDGIDIEAVASGLGVSEENLAIVGAVSGSSYLLVSLSRQEADFPTAAEVQELGNDGSKIVSVDAFESLDRVSQDAWRWVVLNWPPVKKDNVLYPTATWQQALMAIKVQRRALGLEAPYAVIENGRIIDESPTGMLSRFGGPGLVLVGTGNAIVLESGGRGVHILGPGEYRLKSPAFLKRPIDAKGIVDLRPHFASAAASNVRTKEGITLHIKVAMSYQIEPVSITAQRLESLGNGSDLSTRIIGGPEYPVYEDSIRAAVFDTPEVGWDKGLFPSSVIAILRDVMAAYTFDQIFPPNPAPQDDPDPDSRIIKQIEHKVITSFPLRWAGVYLGDFDILEILLPKEIQEWCLRRWADPIRREQEIRDAEAEREIAIVHGEGQARVMEQFDRVRLTSMSRAVQLAQELARTIPHLEDARVVEGFMGVIQELIRKVGRNGTSKEMKTLREPTFSGISSVPQSSVPAVLSEEDESGE